VVLNVAALNVAALNEVVRILAALSVKAGEIPFAVDPTSQIGPDLLNAVDAPPACHHHVQTVF
jgi:hypothetical protein